MKMINHGQYCTLNNKYGFKSPEWFGKARAHVYSLLQWCNAVQNELLSLLSLGIKFKCLINPVSWLVDIAWWCVEGMGGRMREKERGFWIGIVCALVLRRWIRMEQNSDTVKGSKSVGKVWFKRTRERVRSIRRSTELLMIVTYMGVWSSLATRHDVTPEWTWTWRMRGGDGRLERRTMREKEGGTLLTLWKHEQ